MNFNPLSQRGTSTLTTPGFVYFAQAETGGLIKIGWASDPDVRLDRMQPHCPVKLVLLYCFPGNGRQERELHARFSDARRHGEWFEPTPELLATIEDCKKSTAPYEPVAVSGHVPKRPTPANYASKNFHRRLERVRAERGW